MSYLQSVVSDTRTIGQNEESGYHTHTNTNKILDKKKNQIKALILEYIFHPQPRLKTSTEKS